MTYMSRAPIKLLGFMIRNSSYFMQNVHSRDLKRCALARYSSYSKNEQIKSHRWIEKNFFYLRKKLGNMILPMK